MIDLTPLEVRKKKGDFRRIMRGYDPATVDDFLDLAADRLEELVRENLALAEQLAKQNDQVKEYRERERALTDALVTAQEMREEVKRQALREAEQTKELSVQETSQLRQTVEQETHRLRTAAEHEVEQVRAAARHEAEQLVAKAHHEAEQLVAAARHELKGHESALARLQRMRDEFAEAYRNLLERGTTQLEMLSAGMPELEVPEVEAAEPFEPETFEPEPFEPEPFVPEPYEEEAEAGATPEAETLTADEGQTQPPTGDPLRPLMPNEPIAAEAPPADELQLIDELDAGRDDEELAEEAIESLDSILGSLGLGSDEAEDASLSVDAGAEMELYEKLAPENPDDGVPGPIGLSGISLLDEGAEVDFSRDYKPRPSPDGINDGFSHERGVIPVTPPPGDAGAETAEAGPAADDADDDETARLLRNAAAAGYQVPDEDELVLSDAIDAAEDADVEPDDGGWLPDLLEEDEK